MSSKESIRQVRLSSKVLTTGSGDGRSNVSVGARDIGLLVFRRRNGENLIGLVLGLTAGTETALGPREATPRSSGEIGGGG